MIRPATKADCPAMLDIYAPYILNTTYTFEYTVPSVEEFTARFENYTQMCPWLVWEENGTVLGYAYGSLPYEREAYAWCSEISVYLSPSIHGRGIGRQLCTAVEKILFMQGFRVIYSLITTENEASLAFHKKLGYKFSAEFPNCGVKFGRWLGVIWLEKRSNVVEIPSTKPVSWLSIVESNGKSSNILDKLSIP